MSRVTESENDDSIYEEYDGIYEEYESVNEENGPKEGKKVTETQDQASASYFCSRLGSRPRRPCPKKLKVVVPDVLVLDHSKIK